MWGFFRRSTLYFLIGFIVAFVIFLFFKLSNGELMAGLAIGAVSGVVVTIAIFVLERRFPDNPAT